VLKSTLCSRSLADVGLSPMIPFLYNTGEVGKERSDDIVKTEEEIDQGS